MKLVDMKKMPKVSIILYSFATIMTICTLFIIYKSNAYISDLVAQGFDPSKEIVEVINYYIVTVTPYVFYTICLFTLGYIIKKVDCVIKKQNTQLETVKNEYTETEEVEYVEIKLENNDDEIDDFLK